MTPSLLTPAVELLASLTTPEEGREKAWEVGSVRRTGKACPYELFMVVVLGLSARGTTSCQRGAGPDSTTLRSEDTNRASSAGCRLGLTTAPWL